MNRRIISRYLLRSAFPLLCWATLFCWSTNTEAGVEARCVVLGANCLSSEPLNTNVYAASGDSYNPGDTTVSDKQASWSGTGLAIETISGSQQIPFGAGVGDTAYNALPALAKSNLTYVMRTPAGSRGSFNLGHNLSFTGNGASYTKRMAWRAYVYHTSDFDWTENACHNGKIYQGGTLIIDNGGIPNFRDMTGWTISSPYVDCCNFGPRGSAGNTPNYAWWKGYWVRLEVVMVNRTGGTGANSWQFYMYGQRLGTAEPELEIMNSRVPDVGYDCTDPTTRWCSTYNVTPAGGRIDAWGFNRHRGTGVGGEVCNGYHAMTHWMQAGWDTDAGQRIGAATEIEGGGADKTPPAIPAGLTLLP